MKYNHHISTPFVPAFSSTGYYVLVSGYFLNDGLVIGVTKSSNLRFPHSSTFFSSPAAGSNVYVFKAIFKPELTYSSIFFPMRPDGKIKK
jgi:hypothetical protein